MTARGIAASVVASVLFGAVYFIPATLATLTEWEVVGWRILFTVPLVAVLLVGIRSWGLVTDALALFRRRPALLAVLLLNSALLGVQLWLFAWAPKTGHGLDVAVGYLLMPLLLVLIGVLFHRERLGAVRTAAVIAAAVGVAAAFFGASSLSWATVVVVLGYPLYFTIRRHLGLDNPGAMLLELLVLLPVAGWLAVGPGSSWGGGGEHPWMMLLTLGVVSAVALTLYVVASRLLTFSLFGLLSYIEPILLVLVALMLLGESIQSSDYLTYFGIGLAVVLLMVEGVLSLRGRPGRAVEAS